MKSLLFIFLLSLLFSQSAGSNNQLPIDPATGKITYADVVQLDDPLGAVWPLAFEWMVKNSDTDVVQIDNGDVSKMIGKSRMQVFTDDGNTPAGHINFTITVAVKDQRYRYEFSNFAHTGQFRSEGVVFPDLGPCETLRESLNRISQWSDKKYYNNIGQQLDWRIQKLITDLQKTIEAGIAEADTGW